MIIGLTGSIAMGKSEVAKLFKEAGIPVFDADAEVHALYDSKEGAELLRPIVPEATRNRRVDRALLKQAIQADSQLLSKIEKRVHGRIKAARNLFIAQARVNAAEMIVLEIPLLFETDSDRLVDCSIVVSSPPHLQRKRALARPAMTEAQLDYIQMRQMPDDEKRRRATYVIENDGTLEELRQRTKVLINQLKNHRDKNA